MRNDDYCVIELSCKSSGIWNRNNVRMTWHWFSELSNSAEICPNTIHILHHRFEVGHMTGPENEQAFSMQTCATHLCFYFNLTMHDCHISGCLYAKKRGSIRRKIESCATTYWDSHHNFIRWP